MNGKKARRLRRERQEMFHQLELAMSEILEAGGADSELIHKTKELFRKNSWFCGNVEEYQFWISRGEGDQREIHFQRHPELDRKRLL